MKLTKKISNAIKNLHVVNPGCLNANTASIMYNYTFPPEEAIEKMKRETADK